MNLKKSGKVSVFFVALATALCFAATTPAMARGGFGGHGGGGSHAAPHFNGGGGYHGGSHHFGGGRSRNATPQYGNRRGGSSGQQFLNQRGFQGHGSGIRGYSNGNPAGAGQRGGNLYHPLTPQHGAPQGQMAPQGPGGMTYQYGQIPPPPPPSDDGVNPLEILGEILQFFSGSSY